MTKRRYFEKKFTSSTSSTAQQYYQMFHAVVIKLKIVHQEYFQSNHHRSVDYTSIRDYSYYLRIYHELSHTKCVASHRLIYHISFIEVQRTLNISPCIPLASSLVFKPLPRSPITPSFPTTIWAASLYPIGL